MAEELVSCEIAEGIAEITLDDTKRNALSPALLTEFEAAVDAAESADAAIVLAGREGAFSAGYDLRVVEKGMDEMLAMMDKGAGLMIRLLAYPKPVVIACTGHAIAGGALFLCCADRRVGAAGDFKIGMNEVSIGLPVPAMANELIRDRIVTSEVTRATLEAHLYDPVEARSAGWLDDVVGADALITTARADAERMLGLNAAAFATSKAIGRKDLLGRLNQARSR